MSKFIAKLFRFLIFSLLLYIPLVIIWAEFEYDSFIRKNIKYEFTIGGPIDSSGIISSSGHLFTRMQELETTKDVDLLFIGSSQAYRGFDTRIFKKAGYHTFNLGSSDQTPLQSEVLLKSHLNQLNPKMIVYVVYPEVFSVDGVESTLNIIANDHTNFELIKLVLKQKNLNLTNTLIYTIYRDVFNLNKDFKEPIHKGNDTYIGAGYVEKELMHYGYHHFDASTWEFNQDQFKALERTLKMIHDKKIGIILVQAPTPKLFYTSQTNNDEFDDMMKAYGEYYNFNQLIDLDDSLHFYNAFHMNQLGVEIFNKKFIEMLN